MNDQHEDIEPDRGFTITENGKLSKADNEDVDFEENLTFEDEESG